MIRIYILLALVSLLTSTNVGAQCTQKNTAFKSGETLSYNLYYNWQFIWIKAGTASLKTVETTYKGQKAYRTSLLTRTNKRLDKFFCMRDTLLSYCTLDMAPLYYRKGAHEGNYYTVDEVFYSYPNGVPTVDRKSTRLNSSH